MKLARRLEKLEANTAPKSSPQVHVWLPSNGRDEQPLGTWRNITTGEVLSGEDFERDIAERRQAAYNAGVALEDAWLRGDAPNTGSRARDAVMVLEGMQRERQESA